MSTRDYVYLLLGIVLDVLIIWWVVDLVHDGRAERAVQQASSRAMSPIEAARSRGEVVVGMTEAMVYQVWGRPDLPPRQDGTGATLLSYPDYIYMDRLGQSPGRRRIVTLEGGVVTSVRATDVFYDPLDEIVGWDQRTVVFFFGMPYDRGDTALWEDWDYTSSNRAVRVRFLKPDLKVVNWGRS